MNVTDLVGIILGVLGIVATAVVGIVFYIRSKKIITRMNAILTAHMSLNEYKAALRLVDDIEKTGTKRGTIAQIPDGTWVIHWNPTEAVDPRV
jgi:hypothetical protein